MKFKREDFIRETALIQRGLTRISKSPLNILNYSLLGLGIFIIIFVVQNEVQNSKGLVVLAGLTICNLIFIFGYSFGYFSRVISEEKQSKTMTLLRLTPVRSTNIFFGKLMPPFINLMQMLVFQIPIVIFMITFGGTSIEQILKIYTLLILISACFAVIGIWVSSNNPENWLAYFNFLFMSFLLALIYGSIQMVRYVTGMRGLADLLRLENPLYKCFIILQKPQESITLTVIGCIIFILIGLRLSYKSFLKNIDFETIVPESPKGKTVKRKVDFGRFPILQKEYFFGCGGKTSQILIFGLLTLASVLFYFAEKSPYSKYDIPSIFTNMLILQFSCLALFLIYSIGNSFKKEMIDNTWESLVLTPLTASQIINQKIFGSIKFLSPIAVIIILFYLIDFDNWGRDFRHLKDQYNIFWVAPFFYITLLSSFIFYQTTGKKISLFLFLFTCSILITATGVIDHNNDDSLLHWSISLVLLAFSYAFYRLSIKAINSHIYSKSED